MSRERDDRAVDGDADVLRIDFRAAAERGVDVGLDHMTTNYRVTILDDTAELWAHGYA